MDINQQAQNAAQFASLQQQNAVTANSIAPNLVQEQSQVPAQAASQAQAQGENQSAQQQEPQSEFGQVQVDPVQAYQSSDAAPQQQPAQMGDTAMAEHSQAQPTAANVPVQATAASINPVQQNQANQQQAAAQQQAQTTATPEQIYLRMTPGMKETAKQLFDAVKYQIFDKVQAIVDSNDCSQLVNDLPGFYQSALFAACSIRDEEAAQKTVSILLSGGHLSFYTCTDSLKQSPIYYAVKEGHSNLINFILANGCNVNQLDTYGQTPIFYCIREGNVKVTSQLIELGADPDIVDLNGQTPLYYAIKAGRYEMVEFLIKKKVNLSNVDLRGKTPSHWARQTSKTQILELLIQHGAPPITSTKPPVQKEEKTEQLPPVSEKKQPRRYVLTTLRENGHYEPITDEEFEEFRKLNPDMASYFEDMGESNPIDSLEVPEMPDINPVYTHWEEAARRLMQNLARNKNAWLFNAPVDPVALCLNDYTTIIKNPMDFLTIKNKLKEHKYSSLQEYLDDMDTTFNNCAVYNGPNSDIGRMGQTVNDEYQKQLEQLNINFYM